MSNKVKNSINKIVKRLKDYHPQKIILFGSAARGEKKINDLDFFLIKKTKTKFHQRFMEIDDCLKDMEIDYPVDVIVYTPSEYKTAVKQKRYLTEQIIREGKYLYG